jgi:DNA-binding MarR family transcriptional regulator
MKHLPRNVIATKAQQIGMVIDHLVAALGGDPSSPVRRASILADIDQYPGTSQSSVMDRLGLNKSALTRDIEWLYDHGCITRATSAQDAREIQLRTCGYAKRNLDLALVYFEKSHESLKNFLNSFISLFGDYKPTLRDAKIIAVVGDLNDASRQRIFEGLYHGPSTTENRALNNLIELGFVEKDD